MTQEEGDPLPPAVGEESGEWRGKEWGGGGAGDVGEGGEKKDSPHFVGEVLGSNWVMEGSGFL